MGAHIVLHEASGPKKFHYMFKYKVFQIHNIQNALSSSVQELILYKCQSRCAFKTLRSYHQKEPFEKKKYCSLQISLLPFAKQKQSSFIGICIRPCPVIDCGVLFCLVVLVKRLYWSGLFLAFYNITQRVSLI